MASQRRGIDLSRELLDKYRHLGRFTFVDFCNFRLVIMISVYCHPLSVFSGLILQNSQSGMFSSMILKAIMTKY